MISKPKRMKSRVLSKSKSTSSRPKMFLKQLMVKKTNSKRLLLKKSRRPVTNLVKKATRAPSQSQLKIKRKPR
jgi:hypothetical protein